MVSPGELLVAEERKAERQINWIRLGMSGSFLLLFGAFYFTAKTHYTASYFILAALVIWFSYSAWLLRGTKPQHYRGWYKYASITIDLLAVSTILVAALFQSTGQDMRFRQDILAIIFMLIAVTALRQSSISSIYTGVAASLVFIGANLIVAALGGISISVSNMVMIVIALLATAAIAARAANRQRQLLLQYTEAERLRILDEQVWRVHRLESEVKQRTAELAAAKDEAEQHAVELEAIRQATLNLTARLDLESVLNALLESTLRLIPGMRNAHIFLYDSDGEGVLTFGTALWSDGRRGQPVALPRPQGLTYTVARSAQTVVVKDIRDHPLYTDISPDMNWRGAIVGLPLKIGQRVVGVMTLSYPQPHEFSEVEQRVMRLLGDQAAIAIENAHLHKLVNQQARTDSLTGLPNRCALDERLEDETRRSTRYQRVFSLVMMDLNGFKAINDTYGHPEGDAALRQVASCMLGQVRETDLLARYGGDEFALLMPETDRATAQSLAVRLRDRVGCAALVLPDSRQITLSISFGLAAFPENGATAEDLLACADQALYQDKRQHYTQAVSPNPNPV